VALPAGVSTDEMGRALSDSSEQTFRPYLAVAGIVVVAVGLLCFVMSFTVAGRDRTMAQQERTFHMVAVAGMGIVVLLVGGGLTALAAFLPARRIILCENGLVETNGYQNKLYFWDDIEGVSHLKIRVVYRRGGTRDFFQMWLWLNTGECLEYGTWFTDLDRVARRTQRMVRDMRFPAILQAWRAGQEVSFGPIRVSRHGVSVGKRHLPWEQVEQFTGEEGHLIIHQHYRQDAWARLDAREVPNLYLLREVLEVALKER
jgi:hypothetical protein